VNEKNPTNTIPPIKRARGCYLYDYKGRRCLDLYRQNGAALLGYRTPNLTRVMKQVMSKGLIADLPSIYEKRLFKAVRLLLPAYKDMRVVTCGHRALELASLYLGGKGHDNTSLTTSGIMHWRPFMPPAEVSAARVLIPILPFAVGGCPAVVCFRDALPADFPASESVSPLLLAGLTRACYDLLQHRMPDWYTDRLLAGAPGWEQQGPYITARFAAERYPDVFREFLRQGFLLSPTYPGPSVLPWEISPGELQKMCKLFTLVPGE
jgi:hypothetical protein